MQDMRLAAFPSCLPTITCQFISNDSIFNNTISCYACFIQVIFSINNVLTIVKTLCGRDLTPAFLFIFTQTRHMTRMFGQCELWKWCWDRVSISWLNGGFRAVKLLRRCLPPTESLAFWPINVHLCSFDVATCVQWAMINHPHRSTPACLYIQIISLSSFHHCYRCVPPK